MKNFSARLLTLVALVAFSCVSPALAQKRMCPTPPPSPFKHSGTIVTSYDRNAGGMRTTLTHPRALGSTADALYMTASFLYPNPKRPSRLAVDIAFVSASRQARYQGAHNLVFLADGRELPLVGAPTQYQTAKAGDGQLLEATRVTLPYDMLLSLLHARRVTARLGSNEVELTGHHLEALRELASLMAPSPLAMATH